jgi:hypothetical protein
MLIFKITKLRKTNIMDIGKELLYFTAFIFLVLALITLLPSINTLVSVDTPYGAVSFSIKSIFKYLHILGAVICAMLYIKERNPVLLIIASVLIVSWRLLF